MNEISLFFLDIESEEDLKKHVNNFAINKMINILNKMINTLNKKYKKISFNKIKQYSKFNFAINKMINILNKKYKNNLECNFNLLKNFKK